MSDFTLSCRESGEEDKTDLELRSATEKYTIGTVDSEYAPHIVACVNACRDLPDDILRDRAKKLSTANAKGEM